MEVTTPPAGSVGYGSPVLAPDGRVLVGRTGSYRYLMQPEDMPYINIKDFGAVGDGVTDDTDAWDEALSVAKVLEMPLYLPSGKYPVSVSVDTVDMTGCSGIIGNGEIVFTSTGNPDRPLLRWLGAKQSVADDVEIIRGQTDFTISTGLSISKGDTIFVVSNEGVYPDLDSGSANYKKGGRFTVENYNPTTGDLACYEPSYFDISSGYIYWNSSRPRVSLSASLSIVGDRDKKGIEVTLGELFVNNAKVNGFGRFGINSSSSLTRINDSLIYAEAIPSTTTGYSLQCSGLSDVIFFNSVFYGNRHGVACGDSGYWRSTDVGVVSPDVVIALPPIVRGSGCRIEGTSYALDSHAGTTLLDVYNSEIYGGVIFGGLESYVTGSRIHQGSSDMAVRFGRDRELNSGNYLGKYSLKNCEIYASTQFLGINADLDRVALIDINVYPTPSSTPRTFINYNSGSMVLNWVTSNFNSYGTTNDDVEYYFRTRSPLTLINSTLSKSKLRAEIRSSATRDIKLIGCTINTDVGNAIYVDYFAGNKSVDFYIDGCTILDSPVAIFCRGVRSMMMSATTIRGNTLSISMRQSSGSAISAVISGCAIDHASGDFIASQAGQTTNLTLLGNVFAVSSTIGANVVVQGKYGNIGLNDKLKTSLTTSTTTKYGADTTTGDLTLS